MAKKQAHHPAPPAGDPSSTTETVPNPSTPNPPEQVQVPNPAVQNTGDTGDDWGAPAPAATEPAGDISQPQEDTGPVLQVTPDQAEADLSAQSRLMPQPEPGADADQGPQNARCENFSDNCNWSGTAAELLIDPNLGPSYCPKCRAMRFVVKF
jgi:hypothetical protein